MVIVIRIVLALVALMLLYPMYLACSWNILGEENYSQLDCVAKFAAITIGIPLAIASIVGFFKKSKDIFWNTFVGALFIGAVALFILMSL
jgi:hypothetical protein